MANFVSNPSLSSLTMRRIRRIHFIGIGGVGMCGIAEVLLNLGYEISGSDLSSSKTTERLKNIGANVFLGHDPSNVTGVDVVVVSSMIDEQNPEWQAAKEKRIPIVRRAEMLAELMRFRYGIAIAGTHGKTTTTSLITSLLASGDLDPTFIIGGLLNSAGSNAHLGAGQYLVAEADESDASFLYLQPMISVVTNIDADHLSNYQGDFELLKKTFVQFLHHLPFYGLAVLCIDDPIIAEILPKIARPILTYGFDEKADVRVTEFEQRGMRSYFKVIRHKDDPGLSVQLNLPGRHNVLNAAAAIAVATELNVSDQAICNALEGFAGVGRRMQVHGELPLANGSVTVMEDYGHHPRELEVTLAALQTAYPDRRLMIAFQPHRYSRTQECFDEFVRVLSSVENLLLLDIYPAGEEPIAGISAEELANAIEKQSKKKPVQVGNTQQLFPTLKKVLQPGDLLLLQGAGSIGSFAVKLVTEGLDGS